MYISLIRFDPVAGIIYIASMILAILISLILHECAHGYMALRCGDPTAKMLGRLSLNPARHLDPIGTVCMVLFGFGWARPVPVNPRNFRDYRHDDFLVSIAGITVNMTLFLLTTALMVGLERHVGMAHFMVKNSYLISGKQFTGMAAVLAYFYQFVHMLAQINLSLAVFNFLPIPPLDGYHLLNDTLLKGRFQLNGSMFQYAQMLLIILCCTGSLSGILSAVTGAVNDAVYNLFRMMIP